MWEMQRFIIASQISGWGDITCTVGIYSVSWRGGHIEVPFEHLGGWQLYNSGFNKEIWE